MGLVFYHIRIIPMTWSGIRNDLVLIVSIVVDDGFQRCPRILDVIVIAPQITMLDDRREVGLDFQIQFYYTFFKKRFNYFPTVIPA